MIIGRLAKHVLLPVALALFVTCVQAQTVTLHEELRTMLNEHPRLKSARSNEQAADWEVERATDNYFPVFSIYGETGPDKYTNPNTTFGQERELDRSKVTYELRQNLFRGFRDQAAVSGSEAERKIADFSTSKTTQELLLEGISVYIDALRVTMLGNVVSEKVDVAQQLLDIKKRARQSGGGTDVDVLEASLAIQKALDEKLISEAELRSTTVRYAQLFNRDNLPGKLTPVEVPASLVPASAEAALLLAREHNPDLAMARLQMDVASSIRENAVGEYYPTLDLVGRRDYDRNLEGQEGARHEKAVLLQLNWQFNLGNQAGAAVSSAAEKYTAAKFDYYDAQKDVEQRVQLAYERYANLDARRTLADETLTIAERVLESRREQRRSGKVDETVVIAARARMIAARYTAVLTHYEAIKAAYELGFIAGLLTEAELGLVAN
ncbi:MAG: TolC family protein [Granulosicoccaceae bacterium]|jgi:outer membrane protein TolC